MSSTSDAPSRTILQELDDLFSWNPPPLIHNPNKRKSTASRRPTFYDKHFSDKAILKRVVHVPSLVRDLAEIVDSALEAAKPALPPFPGRFIKAKQRDSTVKRQRTRVRSEKGVGEFFQATTGDFCPPVASTLLLHPDAVPEWQSLISFTSDVSSSGYATMDGEHSFQQPGTLTEVERDLDTILEKMDSVTRRFVQRMRASETPLITFQFKSLTVGPFKVMDAIIKMSEFSWDRCEFKPCKDSDHKRGRDQSANTVLACDALNPPWNLLAPQSSPTTRSTTKAGDAPSLAMALAMEQGKVSGHTGAGPSTMSLLNLEPLPLNKVPQLGPSIVAPSITSNREEKRKRTDSDVFFTESTITPLSSEEPTPVKDKDKKRQKCDDDVNNNDASDPTYEDPSNPTHEDPSPSNAMAHSFLQQAWAQATKVDTSVIVLHSGNHEVIGIRHRYSQTLFVSDVIIPHQCVNPGYGKIHVGIIIAAVRDAMDRMEQNDKQADDGGQGGGRGVGGPEADSPSGGYEGESGAGGLGTGRPGAGGFEHRRDKGVGDKAAERLDIEEMVYVSSNCDLIHIYLWYGVYDSPIPASFIRSLPLNIPPNSPPFSPRHCTYGGQCMIIVITSEIGQGATGVALRGTLRPKNVEGAGSLDAVVKLAFDAQQRDSLKREYELYLHLKFKGVHRGITPTIGFFDDIEGSACALVMLYAGVPISTLDPGRMLSTSDYDLAMSTLESIHHAGIIHDDIRPENILVGDSGVTIIDFGHAKRCNSKKAKDAEREIFQSILRGSAGENQ